MNLIDTHTHLYVEAFDEDRKQVIERAVEEGVQKFFIPAIDSAYVASMYELEQLFPDRIHLMAGLHPTHVKENFEEELELVEKQLRQRRFYGVGETGIDLYWDDTFIGQQKIAFARQIRMAKEHELPVIIHCRDAFDEVFEVLEEEKSDEMFGIFHCFTGNKEQAELAIGYGLKLGIGGVATFKNGKIDKFLDQIDLNHIVLETDAPYLAPKPHRGKRNESAYLTLVAQKLAEIYGVEKEEIARITTENACEVFKI
ncbi:TatD family hydrolase [Robertkochia aurantiaca]|uniref:TatD family hydrolase n=1 Tax=Robertkochia aurantiaca TaxID=2873700 RepID=UPI001CCF946C|nr:TatD family hydrolase [Robertkochia sp. 3YJGBD-33]